MNIRKNVGKTILRSYTETPTVAEHHVETPQHASSIQANSKKINSIQSNDYLIHRNTAQQNQSTQKPIDYESQELQRSTPTKVQNNFEP